VKTSLLFPSALLLGLFVSGCGHKGKHPSETPEIVQDLARKQAKEAKNNLMGLKSSHMTGATLGGGDSMGRPLWKVSADQIQTAGTLEEGTPKQAVLTNAKATLFRAGKADSYLWAPTMTLFNTGKGVRLQMTKSVRGESAGVWTGNRGTIKFTAPHADVDVQTRTIDASGGVVMTQGPNKVTGQKMHSVTALQKVDVTGKVHGTGDSGQVVDADTATYDWQNDKLVAQKVIASQKGTQITGDTLNADTNANKGTLNGHVVAKSAQGTANAPKVDFDWKKNLIVSNDAVFNGQGGTLRASRIQTDSKLNLAKATNVVAQKDGATLHANSADGFDGLNRITGHTVNFVHEDLTLTAPRADATKKGNKWVLVATGGAHGKNASGTISAPRVTWDEGRNSVLASGGVTMDKEGSTLMGATLNSDTKFNNATLTGNVHGKMQNGSTLAASLLVKSGKSFVASRGTTAHFTSQGQFGPLTMRSPKITAAADGSTATATGGVTVTSATGATVHAPQAIYDRKSGKVTATGGVDFYDPVRGIRQHGDTLVADLGLKVAKLSNPSGQVAQKMFEGKKLF
jgi:lipopolysaccharide export system protein LptA